ncbi:ATP-binding protein [Undibacterium cyanobacteriorum]|uniref:histidine kinase n=1 Tax=Undibacterium cyanobacteriorum TaxID=3073561 RepID=A0ABY9RLQ3_9BURK|nr:ATP-binding protein [Undibacterium sp. 20NA77.5]WMW82142.1 ATP-binding protein [Undibacterium sp. 20NA77.5]
MVNRLFNRILLILVAITIAALLAHEHLMWQSWRIDQLPESRFTVVDDRPEGGQSVASLKQDANQKVLHCKIDRTYQWPFCELAIRLEESNDGVDLRRFDTLRIHLESSGPESANQIRLFIRNFNPAYSKDQQSITLKPHEIVYDPSKESAEVSFNLSQFMVSSWWIQEHPLPSKHLGPELDRVISMSIVTGGNVVQGDHTLTLKKLEFRGPWITAAHFRLIIIFIWIFAIVLYLLWSRQQSQQELKQSDQLREQLRAANEILEARVEERTRALATSNARLIDTLQNLEGARNELVQSEKNAALGNLVSGIAHELNTPIGNALLVGSTLSDVTKKLQQESSTGLTRRALNEFFDDALRGTTILIQNLDRAATLIASFKQLSADQHSGQRRDFSLKAVLEETALAMAPRLKNTHHQLILDVDDDIQMNSYPGPLSQVIINFINNAILHAFEGIDAGTMRLSAHKLDDQHVLIRFEDNGLGISASVLRRIFEPFFTTKLGKGGSGLGMHLAYNVVTQAFGGKIDIQSEPNKGTTIILNLPLTAPNAIGIQAKLGVPKDVLDDYYAFLGDRTIKEVSYFGGPHSRRDVVELALFLRAMQEGLPNTGVELIAVDSYAQGIAKLREGLLTGLATTAWRNDLQEFVGEILMSGPFIRDGQTVVGVYTRVGNSHALSSTNLHDIQQLRIASNKDWSVDWKTLQNLGANFCVDVKTWRQMVYMLSAGEVDAVLAPFPPNDDLSIEFESCRLIPIPGIAVSLHGTRHFAVSRNELGKKVADSVFPLLQQMIDSGTVTVAMRECGFINTSVQEWTVLENNTDIAAQD